MILTENSLYTTPQERENLLDDKKAVATCLLYNFFGFISLYSTSIRKSVKTYKFQEGDVKIKNIQDENLDVSLSLKLAVDSKLNIQPSTIKKMEKLLVKIKSGVISKSDQIDNDLLHSLFVECRFNGMNKPESQLLDVVNMYVNKEITIQWVAFELYKKSKLPQIKTVCGEFFMYYRMSAYTQLYSNIRAGKVEVPYGIPSKYITQITDKTLVYQTTISQQEVNKNTNTKQDKLNAIKSGLRQVGVSTNDATLPK